MSGTQLLRLLVNERLTAAAEEIFGLVEKTIAEYQEEAVRSKREVIQLRQQIEQLTVLKNEGAGTQTVSEDILPTQQLQNVKENQILGCQQVKEEPVDQSISTDVQAGTSNDAEVRRPESEPAINSELVPSSTAETVSTNKSKDDKLGGRDGSSSPRQSHSAEVVVTLEQLSKEERTCRFCGLIFKKDSQLIRHVFRSHKGRKAFKCLECNKEFENRQQVVVHTRIHTGEKPYSCDYCGKAFTQNSSRLTHMRQHTGEKPFFCHKCRRRFATKTHLRFCKMQIEEEEPSKCFECNKEFKRKEQLIQHTRVHTSAKAFSCDICDKTFTMSCGHISHMKQHGREKPYLCKKCGKRFTSDKHDEYCTGTHDQRVENKTYICMTCARIFHTELDLNVHMEVHKSWKRHLSQKLQEQQIGEKKN